jgi:subtilase family serine protease
LGNTSPIDGTPPISGTCKGYPKPNYQVGTLGVPNDKVRDIPDVSLFAANGVWSHYYVFCYSQPAPYTGGAPCTGNPENWSGAGGTSFASPIVAGIQALINQSTGAPQGNPNYVYYALARKEFGSHGNPACNATLGNASESSCTFHDVTEGDIDVNCLGPFNCFNPSNENGVLSVKDNAYEKAYGSNFGWDFATGLGTLNVQKLVQNWEKAF